ncbi:MAG TPA: sodium:solute symporter family protein [bacterium]|nr:sodium:solute symporter family protein [bacterium]
MLDSFVVVLYLAVVLAVGLSAGRNVQNISHFAVSNRSYSSLVIFATLSASFIGGGFSMGNAEKVFTVGIINIVALWGFSLKEILVAKWIAPRMGEFLDAISIGDIMEKNYGKAGKITGGLFSVLLCVGIVGAQVGAMGYIFNVLLGIPQIWGILIGCGIVIVYSAIGGMNAVVATDILQFLLLSVGIPLTLVLGWHYVGGFSAIQAAVPANHFSFTHSSLSFWGFSSLFLTFFFGEALVPPYVQRLLISRDVTRTARGTLWSGLYSIPFFAVAGAIGLIALTMQPDMNPNLALPSVVLQVLPIGIKGFVIAGMISIVMSSADSFLNSASIAFVHDLVKPLRRVPLSEKTELSLAKWTTVVVGVASIIFAVKIKSILDILIYAYNFWAPIILVPLAAALLGYKATSRNFLVGAAAGLTGVAVWRFWLQNPGGFDGLVVGTFCNFIAFTTYYYFKKIKSRPAVYASSTADF